ncbi:hypothetical protein [Yeosuana sp.]|uniref:hypothetical protein n=1 Tax=Yeosuana sp. TaxID=2529388 RepID=UPI00404919C3
MKKLELNELENIKGGDLVGGFCAGVAVTTGGYALGGSLVTLGIASANFWNPVGWVLAVGAAVSIGCAANYIANN